MNETESPAMTNVVSNKVPAKGTPERKQYDRIAKQRSREKAERERVAREIPNVQDYVLPKSQQDQLSENSQKITASIAAELPELTDEDGRMIQMMADVILGHEHKFIKQVYSPSGILYGNFFPDAAASELIEHIHRFPKMLDSKMFSDLYRQFLKLVQKLSKSEWFDPDFAKEIEAEIRGSYKLRPKVEIPKPEPEQTAPQLPKLPTDREILAQGHIRLLEQIQDQIQYPHLSPEARSFLNGGGR